MVYAPGRDSDPGPNGSVTYVPSRGAGGVFAQFMQGSTPKYANNTRGYRSDFYRNTLSRLYVRVDTSEMNRFLGSIADQHTKDHLAGRLVGDPTRQQQNRTTGGAGTTDTTVRAESTLSTNGYLDFFIQQATMPLREKMDVKEVLSDNYASFFFGQAAPVWSFTGWLFNTVQDDQTTNFLRLYLEILRGTQLARRQKVVSLKIDSYVITGVLISTSFNLRAETETCVPFQFEILVKRVAIVNYTVGWVPTRAGTPFAADPNATPYDGRQMPSGARLAVAGILTPTAGVRVGPSVDATEDPRTTQPPAPVDALTAAAGRAAQGAADMVFTAQDVAVDAAVTDALSAVERWDAVTRTDGSVAGSVARAPVPAPAQQRAQQRASGSPSRASSRAAIAQQQAARVAAQREPEAVSYATTTRGPQP